MSWMIIIIDYHWLSLITIDYHWLLLIIISHTANTILLVLCQENENNNVDQVVLTNRLFECYQIRSVYQTHTQLQTSMTITEEGALLVNGQEAALVYFRSGYTPDDYPSTAQWKVREVIECCRAIKVWLDKKKDDG